MLGCLLAGNGFCATRTGDNASDAAPDDLSNDTFDHGLANGAAGWQTFVRPSFGSTDGSVHASPHFSFRMAQAATANKRLAKMSHVWRVFSEPAQNDQAPHCTSSLSVKPRVVKPNWKELEVMSLSRIIDSSTEDDLPQVEAPSVQEQVTANVTVAAMIRQRRNGQDPKQRGSQD